MFIKVLFLCLFFLVMMGVGLYCRRHSTDINGFVLGGRNVGAWLTAFAYGTSYFSAVIFVGYAGQFGWKFGMASTWIGIGNAVIGSLLAWCVLGKRTRVMTQQLKSSTMSDFFGTRFDSKAVKVASAVIIFAFLIPYTASLYNGLSRLFTMAFGIDYTYCVVAMALLTSVYVILGGYMATAVNDFIQGIIMIFGIIAVVAAVLASKGGLMNAISDLSLITDEKTGSGGFATLFGPQPLALLGVVLLTSLGTWGLPQMVQKFYAIKSRSQIKKGTIISTLFAVVVAGGCYFLGGFGRLFATQQDVDAGGFDSIIPKMLEGLPDVLIGLVIILVLSASMSTLSSLVLTSSSSITLDFLAVVSKRFKGEKTKLLTIKIFVAFFVVCSSVIAVVQAKSSVTFIAQLMGISWGTLSGAFLAPFLYGLYYKKTTVCAVWVSFALGVSVMLANMLCSFTGTVFINDYLSSPINTGVAVMLVNLILVPLVSLFTKKPNMQKVEQMFECYKSSASIEK